MDSVIDEKTPQSFIPIRRVLEIAGFSKSTIFRKIYDGEFPAPVIQKGTVTRWDLAEVLQWRQTCIDARPKRTLKTKDLCGERLG